jgi:hypothetical protein
VIWESRRQKSKCDKKAITAAIQKMVNYIRDAIAKSNEGK